MAVNIDTVYQKVLALANKEQRGYVTPQEFNLMAHKAQMEIFNNYFHDLKTAYQKGKTAINHADEMELLHRKMYPFKVQSEITQPADNAAIGAPGFYFDCLSIKSTGNEVTELTQKEFNYSQGNPLTKATVDRPVYTRRGSTMTISPTPTVETIFLLDYFVRPAVPNWGYVVVKGRAMFNGSSTATTHFALHASEEEPLVARILALAGVIIQKPGIVEIGMTDKATTKQDQND